MNTTSPKTTPKSKAIAARAPLIILVWMSIKKTGPIMKERKNPINNKHQVKYQIITQTIKSIKNFKLKKPSKLKIKRKINKNKLIKIKNLVK